MQEITPAYQTTGTTQWTVKDINSAFSEIKESFLLHVNPESTWLLTSIFGHFWPMRVPVRLNFAKQRIRQESERK
ncbi:uncharacterized protein LOC141859024 isoform X3 [Acropora palmata]